jgi:hypothetical protein
VPQGAGIFYAYTKYCNTGSLAEQKQDKFGTPYMVICFYYFNVNSDGDKTRNGKKKIKWVEMAMRALK